MISHLSDETIRECIKSHAKHQFIDDMVVLIFFGIVGLIMMVKLIQNIAKNKILKHGEDTSKSMATYVFWFLGSATLLGLAALAGAAIPSIDENADFYVVRTFVEDTHSSDGYYYATFKNLKGSVEISDDEYRNLSSRNLVYVAVDKENGCPYVFSFTYCGNKLKE